MFRTVIDETEIPRSRCTRCGSPLIYREFSDSTEETVCAQDRNHDGEICKRLGHQEAWGATERCGLCWAPIQWVRVEVSEGKAYTYAAFEDKPLEPGEWVRTPGNVVQPESFAGKVLRVLEDADPSYPGPYKAIIGRLL